MIFMPEEANNNENIEATQMHPAPVQKEAAKKKASPKKKAAQEIKVENAEGQPKEAKEASEAKEVMKPVQNGIGLEEPLLFDKYSYRNIEIRDASLENYISLTPKRYPNTYGKRGSTFAIYMAQTNIVERLVNKLMRGGTGKKIGGKVIRTEGRLQGKKTKVIHMVRDAFAIIEKQTNQNPIQVLVNALENAAPIEDTTRVRYGGIIYNVAVDISSAKRLNVALKNIALAAITNSFKNRRTLAEVLAQEIILTANKDPNSYAVKKRIESERIARSAR